MLYIFDKDNTLVMGIEKDRGKTRPANTPQEQVLSGGVKAKLDTLRKAGHKIAICSNQGGIAWGFRTVDKTVELMEDCAEKIGGADAWEYSPYDPKAKEKNPDSPYAIDHEDRKPGSGMILRLMKRLDTNPEQTIMVGDMPSDAQAAHAAKIKFIWADKFFGS